MLFTCFSLCIVFAAMYCSHRDIPVFPDCEEYDNR